MEVLIAIKKQLVKNRDGLNKWQCFIEHKAICIMRQEKSESGAYQSSLTVDPIFFTTLANQDRQKRLVEAETPFLHNIILCTLQKPIIEVPSTVPEEGINNNEESMADNPQEDSLWDLEGIVFKSKQEATDQFRLAQVHSDLYPSAFCH